MNNYWTYSKLATFKWELLKLRDSQTKYLKCQTSIRCARDNALCETSDEFLTRKCTMQMFCKLCKMWCCDIWNTKFSKKHVKEAAHQEIKTQSSSSPPHWRKVISGAPQENNVVVFSQTTQVAGDLSYNFTKQSKE